MIFPQHQKKGNIAFIHISMEALHHLGTKIVFRSQSQSQLQATKHTSCIISLVDSESAYFAHR